MVIYLPNITKWTVKQTCSHLCRQWRITYWLQLLQNCNPVWQRTRNKQKYWVWYEVEKVVVLLPLGVYSRDPEGMSLGLNSPWGTFLGQYMGIFTKLKKGMCYESISWYLFFLTQKLWMPFFPYIFLKYCHVVSLWDTGWNFWLLAAVWINPGHCGHLEVSQ